jgi:exopolysaccharide production protein ExoZ
VSSKKINSIQLLRVIAVGLVIFLHAGSMGVYKFSASNPVESLYHLKLWGAIGVDLFFAISGFIMTIVAPSYMNPGDWKTFFAKRFIRIIPLYYLISALTALNMLWVHHESITVLSLLKTVFFFPFFDQTSFTNPIVGVGWSLSYEIYFYTLIGILLFLGKDIYRRLLITILLLSTMGLILKTDNPLLKFLTSPILFEFGFGIIGGLLYRKLSVIKRPGRKEKTASIILMGIGLISMCLTIWIWPDFDIHSMTTLENMNKLAFYRAMIWGLPSAIFMLGVILYERFYHLQIWNIIVWAGDGSYSCYLIHAQIYGVVSYIFKYLHLSPILYLIIIVPVCLLVSIVFFRLVERNLITLIDKWLHYKKPVIMD